MIPTLRRDLLEARGLLSRAKLSERIGTLMEPNGDIRHHFWRGDNRNDLRLESKGMKLEILKKSSRAPPSNLCLLCVSLFAKCGRICLVVGAPPSIWIGWVRLPKVYRLRWLDYLASMVLLVRT
ncbi:hypothetical protein Tco_1030009 [Tanacetum coccineum]|uniref:Uncharacterized protein n=1 Tax=Tanacetum coccineum TaxID=301880 RepID=A0ABQ5G516_9ASTR